jgi:phosphopantothenoylcysteine decarboxylase / phosphopantothenate---cysteine ligase
VDDARSLFLFGTGAGSCVRLPELLRALLAQDLTLYSVLTPGVAAVAHPDALMDVPGNHWIRDYGDPPLERYPFGILLVAPCTFNTFGKLANGIADNLATSMVADGLGAGLPVLIAPSMNHGLWAHPHTRLARERLEGWGCTLIDPVVDADQVTMADTADIIAAVRQKIPYHPSGSA